MPPKKSTRACLERCVLVDGTVICSSGLVSSNEGVELVIVGGPYPALVQWVDVAGVVERVLRGGSVAAVDAALVARLDALLNADGQPRCTTASAPLTALVGAAIVGLGHAPSSICTPPVARLVTECKKRWPTAEAVYTEQWKSLGLVDPDTAKSALDSPLVAKFCIATDEFGEPCVGTGPYAGVLRQLVGRVLDNDLVSAAVALEFAEVSLSFFCTYKSMMLAPTGSAFLGGAQRAALVFPLPALELAADWLGVAHKSYSCVDELRGFDVFCSENTTYLCAPHRAFEPFKRVGPHAARLDIGPLLSALQKASRRALVATAAGVFNEAATASLQRLVYRLPVLFVEDRVVCEGLDAVLFASVVTRSGYVPCAQGVAALRRLFLAAVNSPAVGRPFVSSKAASASASAKSSPSTHLAGSLCPLVELLLLRSALPGMKFDQAMLREIALSCPVVVPRAALSAVVPEATCNTELTLAMLEAMPAFHDFHIDPHMLMGALLSSGALASAAASTSTRVGSTAKSRKLLFAPGECLPVEEAVKAAIWQLSSSLNAHTGCVAPANPLAPLLLPVLEGLHAEYLRCRVRPAFADGKVT